MSSFGVDFTNILLRALCAQISKVQKRTDGLTLFFALLGFGLDVKAAYKMLAKWTLGEPKQNLFRNEFINSNNKWFVIFEITRK